MNRSTQCCVGAAALAGVVLLLAGCSAPSPDPTGSSSPSPVPAAEREVEEVAEVVEPAIPLDLTFDAGDALEPESIFAEWVDPFATNPEFAMLSPDDGNGHWSYTDVTNECTVAFYQGLITDLTIAGGDRTSTIDALAAISRANDPELTSELVEEYGVEFSLSQAQEDGIVSLWGLGAELSDGSSWVNSARFFTARGQVYFVSIYCPPGVTAYQELERVIGPVGLQLSVVEAGE